MDRPDKIDVVVEARSRKKPLDGVVIGVLLGLGDGHLPLVVFPGNPEENAITARTTVELSADDVGVEVALMFEGGDAARPIIMGRLLRPGGAPPRAEPGDARPERLTFDAAEEIVLRCGKASVTLTKAGKILLRGAYIFSRSTGVNKLKGGSIQLN
ncbi:MAG: hypothetical protein HC871_10320 [Rhizobiales bacterium]|nr:hypothetical protein [Hyphomicrobiales bacterium]